MAHRRLRHRRQVGVGIGLVALVGCGASLMTMGSAQAGESTRTPDRVIVCESEVINHGGGVETSSAFVVRAATDTPVPDGCRDG